ncbi:MAG: HD domain-containing protein [Akkermansia sp.]
MSVCINVPAHAKVVLDLLEAAGFEAYVVGGCVRDSLLGLTPLDWDVCTKASPQESLRVFADYHCIKTGLQHGTITVMVNKQPVEVTTYRLDGTYSDNRHPDAVQFVSDLREDLARRDFTVNAMAYSPTRGLVDCFNGQQDLQARLIRCVGVATERFEEDGLRIMRALRFASRFGFALDAETTKAIRSGRELLLNVSVERIYKELKGVLVGSGARSMMMYFPEVFRIILPELEPMIDFEPHNKHHAYALWEHTAHAVAAIPADDVLRLAALFHDCGKPATYQVALNDEGSYIGHAHEGYLIAQKALRRLKSDNASMDAVTTLVANHMAVLPTRRAGMRHLIGRLGLPALKQLFQLKRASLKAQQSSNYPDRLQEITIAEDLMEEVLALPACYTIKDLAITGNDLIAMGMKPGPDMKRVLDMLLLRVQDEALNNDLESLRQLAKDFMK